MERNCNDCKWEHMNWNDPMCYGCRLLIKDRSNWEPKVLENMDVASWYPKNAIYSYLANDVKATQELYFARGRSNGKTLYTLDEMARKIGCRVVADSWFRSVNMPGIEKVIFNDPATIVIWDDGTKTVVKAQGNDIFDPEKGLAMAVSKKALGNKGNYFEEFKKWLPEERVCAGNCHVCCPIETNDPKKATENCKDCEGFLKRSEVSKDAISKLTKAITATEENWQKTITTYLEGLNKNKCQ